MDAVISGRAGVAFLIDGARYCSLHADEPGRPLPRSAADFRLLLGGTGDLEYLEDVDQAQAARHLRLARDRAEALHLTLILLDPTLPDPIRGRAAGEVERLFGDYQVVIHVRNVLYSRPLDTSADLRGSRALVRDALGRLGLFLADLDWFGPTIDRVRTAWMSIPAGLFDPSRGARRDVESALVREGVVSSQMLNLAFGYDPRIEIRRALSLPAIRRIEDIEAILEAWQQALRGPEEPDETIRAPEAEAAGKAEQALPAEDARLAPGQPGYVAWARRQVEVVRRAPRPTRRRLHGTAERPRLAVFRSSKHIYAQLVDDDRRVTLASASTLGREFRRLHGPGRDEAAAAAIGKLVAERAMAVGIHKACIDRRTYKYHGKVRALFEAARAAGIDFDPPDDQPTRGTDPKSRSIRRAPNLRRNLGKT